MIFYRFFGQKKIYENIKMEKKKHHTLYLHFEQSKAKSSP